jgi:hypothetical protein
MTQNEIARIEEKIRRDWSLSEEKKAELINLLTTMKSEKPDRFSSTNDQEDRYV